MNYSIFSLKQVALLAKEQPELELAIEIIKTALLNKIKTVGNILAGEVTNNGLLNNDSTPFTMTSLNNSVLTLLDKASDIDMYMALQIFEDGGVQSEYSDSLLRCNIKLTDEQLNLYNSLAESFSNLKKYAHDYIPNDYPGWFPQVRNGNFTVTLYLPGSERVRGFNNGVPDITTAAHVQTFFGKREAEIFLEWFHKLPANEKGDLYTDGVKERDDDDSCRRYYDRLKDAMSFFENNEFSTPLPTYDGNYYSDRMLYLSIPGYKGNEYLKNAQERGRSFKEAIVIFIENFTDCDLTEEISTKISALIDNIERNVRTHKFNEPIKTLARQVTNKNESTFKTIEDKINCHINYMADMTRELIAKITGTKPKYGQEHFLNFILNNITLIAYRHDYIGRFTFYKI